MAQLSRLMSRLNPTFAPCLPRPAKEPPAAPGWIHEIKHDGFRILAGRDRERVRLFTRHGTDFTAPVSEDRRRAREPDGAVLRARRAFRWC
jgi:ATP-dependent DNA ligase